MRLIDYFSTKVVARVVVAGCVGRVVVLSWWFCVQTRPCQWIVAAMARWLPCPGGRLSRFYLYSFDHYSKAVCACKAGRIICSLPDYATKWRHSPKGLFQISSVATVETEKDIICRLQPSWTLHYIAISPFMNTSWLRFSDDHTTTVVIVIISHKTRRV